MKTSTNYVTIIEERDKHIASDDWSDIARAAYEAQQAKKYFADKEKELMEKLKNLTNQQSHTDGHYVLKHETRKGTIDYKAIPELKTVDLEYYRKDTVQIWKLSALN